MAIKAVLMINTSEIRKRIENKGLTCTSDPNSFLFYNEITQSVTWDYRTEFPAHVLNCKENVELFFQLLDLKTIVDEDKEELYKEVEMYKKLYDNQKKELNNERDLHYAVERELLTYKNAFDSLQEVLKTTQDSNKKLKEEIQTLKSELKSHG